MTVSRTDNKAKFNCNGSTYQFTFEFPVQDDDDVVVVLIDSSGGETVLTKGTHYAIADSTSALRRASSASLSLMTAFSLSIISS